MSKRVLVVEDNPLNMELARDLLEDHGYEVLEAADWVECLAVLSTRRPDLVLMDVQLPDKDGLQITRELRADPRYADLLIVAMTAHAMTDDEQRVREAGCDGYLTKPIDTRTLAQHVERYLALASERREGNDTHGSGVSCTESA
jgi:CheY-like chemotaxis protein